MTPPLAFWSLAAAGGLVLTLSAIGALYSHPRRLTWYIVAYVLGLLLIGLALGGAL